MKNIQVIDGADNCVFDIFQVEDKDFALLFGPNEDIAFSEDFEHREDMVPVFKRLLRNRIPKVEVQSIHGTYFIGLAHKRAFYPTRRDEEATNPDGSRLRSKS